MIACEILMMSMIIILALLSGYADCRTSQVPNRLLLPFAASALALNALYYMLWAGTWFSAFCINLVFLTGSAILLYAYHIWAAGDSKLLIVIALLLPGRYLSFVKLGAVPGFMILVIAFIIAFLYIIAESVILAIREHSMVRNPAPFRFNWKSWLISYLFMAGALSLVGALLLWLFPQLYTSSQIQVMALHSIVILSLIQLRSHISPNAMIIITSILWVILLILSVARRHFVSFSLQWKSWALIFGVLLILHFAQRFNYRTIPTSEVKAGQILSAATVLRFRSSRIKGLPTETTEDLRSRLTADETESVRRWANSSKGQQEITIVRKIPFAIFIGMGTIGFILMEVLMQ